MAVATKKQALEAKVGTRRVPAPECGKDVEFLMEGLRGLALVQLERKLYPVGPDGRVIPNAEHARALRVIACARAEDGTALFSDADLPSVMNMPGGLLSRLSAAAMALNGDTAVSDVEPMTAAEAEAKNS